MVCTGCMVSRAITLDEEEEDDDEEDEEDEDAGKEDADAGKEDEEEDEEEVEERESRSLCAAELLRRKCTYVATLAGSRHSSRLLFGSSGSLQ